jgi:methylamine dehydrogenase heavy chain
LLAVAAFPMAALADEPNDTVTIAKLPESDTHRVYLMDSVFTHLVDGRIWLVDADSLKSLGMIATSYSGQFTLSPKGDRLYVSTTYYSRLNHGERVDVVDTYDTKTLHWLGEIKIPPKHAQASSYPGMVMTSVDGKYLFAQNATPASSVTLVDLTKKKFVAEIGTAGCWTSWPSPKLATRFSTICGDGAAVTFDFNDAGKVTKSTRSEKLFDPEADPIFAHGADLGAKTAFISYFGTVHVVDFTGAKAVQEEPWSFVSPEDKAKNWRPGGSQIFVVHKKSGRMFVLMHEKGFDGSHKNSADEIWVVDLKSHKVLQRVPGERGAALGVTQDDHPLLVVSNGDTGTLVAFDATAELKRKGESEKISETGVEVVTR